jgi:hypothetical protein
MISTAGLKKEEWRSVQRLISENRVPQTCGNDIDSDDRYQKQDNIDDERRYFWCVANRTQTAPFMPQLQETVLDLL